MNPIWRITYCGGNYSLEVRYVHSVKYTVSLVWDKLVDLTDGRLDPCDFPTWVPDWITHRMMSLEGRILNFDRSLPNTPVKNFSIDRDVAHFLAQQFVEKVEELVERDDEEEGN